MPQRQVQREIKRCPRCQVIKPASEFCKSSRNRDGLGDCCRLCDRARTLKHKRTCLHCQKEFLTSATHINRGDGLFCSKGCATSYNVSRVRFQVKNEHLKEDAHQKTLWSIRAYPEQKPKICSLCKSEADVIAHHNDYEQWFKVCWLCRSCHRGIHNGSGYTPQEAILCQE